MASMNLNKSAHIEPEDERMRSYNSDIDRIRDEEFPMLKGKPTAVDSSIPYLQIA